MTTAPDPLDLHARQLHAGAVLNVSAPTLARLRQGVEIASWDSKTFYLGGHSGYLDYPTFSA